MSLSRGKSCSSLLETIPRMEDLRAEAGTFYLRYREARLVSENRATPHHTAD